jgi:SHS2 domain-containing protein
MREGMSYRSVDDLSLTDAGFEAEGASLIELCRSAVDATLAVMVGDPEAVQPSRSVPVLLEAADPAGLLFWLLQEVIYRKDAEGSFLRLAEAGIAERDGRFVLTGTLRGEPLDRSRHVAGTDVKAVTLHRFEVLERDGLWHATVVLDV